MNNQGNFLPLLRVASRAKSTTPTPNPMCTQHIKPNTTQAAIRKPKYNRKFTNRNYNTQLKDENFLLCPWIQYTLKTKRMS